MRTIVFIIVCFKSFSQNMIYNGDFEFYRKCPNDISQISRAKGWITPSEGTSDYFNSCSNNPTCSVPKNIGGKVYAKSGNGYAAIAVGIDNDGLYRYEFIQTSLVNKLKKNQAYCLSFYVHKAPITNVYFNSFSCLVSNNRIKIKKWNFIDKEMINSNKYLTKSTDSNINNTWSILCFTFTATGKEKYVTIGYDEIKSILVKDKKSKNKNKELSYYIDDVSLVEIKDSIECSCQVVKEESVEVDTVKSEPTYSIVNTPIVLKNIEFEITKAVLLPESNTALNELANYLNKNSDYNIEISGHTDNTGTEAENNKLSEARAKAVADYLINMGIVPKRVSYKGYGSTKPIKPNNSEQNKKENRRVEVKLKKG